MMNAGPKPVQLSRALLALPSRHLTGAATFLVLVVASCATLPTHVERIPTQALSAPEGAPLVRAVAATFSGANLSGFRLMAAGDLAYDARLTLVEHAQRSLDLQYYWVASDPPTRILFAALRNVAARGVRVRLLLDDLSAARHDTGLLRLSHVPNVQVRIFNPFVVGRANVVTRMVFSVGDLGRVMRRMHNKMFIADNTLAIVGGRNLTAEYFSHDQAKNFADLDVLAGGAIVPRLSHAFDEYWNSEEAFPIEALVTAPPSDTSAAATRKRSTSDAPAASGMPASRFDLADLKLVRAPARVLADSPDKATDHAPPGDEAIVYRNVLSILRGAEREVLIMSPYFIPAEEVMALIRDLRARGVTVRILTNSLASTDVVPVFAVYSRHRRDLLDLGIQLYELRPEPGTPRGLLKSSTPSKTALHAKAVLVDGRILFVGSMNLDPRSERQNTENGLIIVSPELGAQLARIFALGASLENSYAVRVSSDGQGLEWTTERSNGESHLSRDPDAGFLRRALTPLLQVTLPDSIL